MNIVKSLEKQDSGVAPIVKAGSQINCRTKTAEGEPMAKHLKSTTEDGFKSIHERTTESLEQEVIRLRMRNEELERMFVTSKVSIPPEDSEKKNNSIQEQIVKMRERQKIHVLSHQNERRELSSEDQIDKEKVEKEFNQQKEQILGLIDTAEQRIAQIRAPYERAKLEFNKTAILFDLIKSNTLTATTTLVDSIFQKKRTEDTFRKVEKIGDFLNEVDTVDEETNEVIKNGEIQKIRDRLSSFNKNKELVEKNKAAIAKLWSLIVRIENEIQCRPYLKALKDKTDKIEKQLPKPKELSAILALEAKDKSSNLKKERVKILAVKLS